MMAFKWDPNKAQSNLREHGVSFETARKVFDDDAVFDILDDSAEEERWKHVGRIGTAVFVVVYTERGDNIRIISARRAVRIEEEAYYQQAG